MLNFIIKLFYGIAPSKKCNCTCNDEKYEWSRKPDASKCDEACHAYYNHYYATIGDSMATLFGIRIRSPRIPYNRRKSVAGFMAIFAFSGIFGYFMIGYAGLGIGVISAVVESVAYYPFDDNFILPVILGAVGSII